MSKCDFRLKFHSRSAVCLCLFAFGLPLGLAQTAPKPNATPRPDPTPNAALAGTQEPAETPASEFDESRKLLGDGKFDEGITSLEALRTKNPAMPGISHELGVAYYKKGDYLKAIAELKKAQEDNPKDAESTQLYGLSAYLAGRPAEARRRRRCLPC